jgi:anti-sigma factor RsiW
VSEPIGPGGITCREVVEIVTDYLEGTLAPKLGARLEAHLARCGSCVEYVGQVRVTARLAALAAFELERRPDRAALLEIFRAFKREPPPAA